MVFVARKDYNFEHLAQTRDQSVFVEVFQAIDKDDRTSIYLFPTSTEFNKVSFFYLNFNQEVKILSPCRSNTSLSYKISICADPENFHMMGMGVGSVWISLKFTKKGFRRFLTSLYIHAYATYEIYIYIIQVFSSANCNYTCNSAK